jgi:signal-transduction protein with cAMP-binding, CBS, and nucleotidyltransferase domain
MKVPGTASHILNSKASSSVWSISPDALVFEAVQMMDFKNIGVLLVVEDGRIAGMLSERDYTRKIILRGKSSRETRVREIMSSPAVVVDPQKPVDECLRLMTEQKVRHLPVVDGDRIVGVLSIGDLVNWVITSQSATIDNLEGYISGRYPS